MQSAPELYTQRAQQKRDSKEEDITAFVLSAWKQTKNQWKMNYVYIATKTVKVLKISE